MSKQALSICAVVFLMLTSRSTAAELTCKTNMKSFFYATAADYVQNINDCTYAIEIEPLNPDWPKHRGQSYFETGNYFESTKDFSHFIRLSPDNYVGYMLRGEAYEKIGEQANALKDYQKYLELTSDYPDSAEEAIFRVKNGREMTDDEKFNRDMLQLNKKIVANPRDAQLYIDRGSRYGYGYYGKNQNIKKAFADYKKAIELEPNSSFPNYELAYFCDDKLKDADKAITHL